MQIFISIAIVATPFVLLIIGVLTNSGQIGSIFGGLAAMAADPVVIVAGLISGILFSRISLSIAVSATVSIIVAMGVSYHLSGWHQQIGIEPFRTGPIILRAFAVFWIAQTLFLVRTVFHIRKSSHAEKF